METRYELMRQEDAREGRLDAIRERAAHPFAPSGFTTSCADGCCREETCALCGQHDDANPAHVGYPIVGGQS